MRPIEADGSPGTSSAALPSGAELSVAIRGQLEALLPIHVPDPRTAGKIRRLFTAFTEKSLRQPAEPPFDGLSHINANGLPFQWVFSLGGNGQGFGFLCEVGRPGASPRQRLVETLDCVGAACRSIGCRAPDETRLAADILLPDKGEAWPEHWRSAAWVGVAVQNGSITLKPYFNLNRGPCRERWLRAGWVLKSLGREAALASLCALSPRCSPQSWPVGLALDLKEDGGVGRVKTYFRSGQTRLDWLERWHEGAGLLGSAPVVRRFLDLFGPVDRLTLPAGAIVASLEIHADQRISLKTDLAVTKWISADGPLLEATAAFLDNRRAASTLASSLGALGLEPRGVDSSSLRFVGLGLEPDGSSHLNLYVEPPLAGPSPPVMRRPRVGLSALDAMHHGRAALLSALQDDHWEDFALPVGRSDAWVTAYILAMLSDLPTCARASLRPQIGAPLDWLAARQTKGGGWGYSRAAPDDADSTAWAVIALSRWERSAPATAIQFLERCGAHGRFQTYPARTSPNPSWSQPAEDVSAIVARALAPDAAAALSCDSRQANVQPRSSSEANRGGALTPAFWWTSPIYVSAMGPFRPSRAVRDQLARFAPAGEFERALLLRAAARAGLPVGALTSSLIAAQKPDGLWPASARLRLVNDGPGAPWRRIDSGPLYSDVRGLFTTATAVGALGSAS